MQGAVISRIKIMAKMDIAEKRLPQDGRIKTVTPDGGEVELRLSTMPTAFGEFTVVGYRSLVDEKQGGTLLNRVRAIRQRPLWPGSRPQDVADCLALNGLAQGTGWPG